jgi:predicted regulator of Ras-like GTPase activity (Roadblock/LC7/MglB family)
MTAFREQLVKIVEATPGGIGAVLIDDEGEAIDLYTTGDSFEIKLAGAHHGIILGLIEQSMDRFERGNTLGGISIRSDRYTFTVVPVRDGIFVVLVQDKDGMPSKGMKVLREAIPSISSLI